MPGQTIGTEMPPPRNRVLVAQIQIWKQDGKYSQTWRPEGLVDSVIAERMHSLLERLIKELNEG